MTTRLKKGQFKQLKVAIPSAPIQLLLFKNTLMREDATAHPRNGRCVAATSSTLGQALIDGLEAQKNRCTRHAIVTGQAKKKKQANSTLWRVEALTLTSLEVDETLFTDIILFSCQSLRKALGVESIVPNH